MTSYYDTDHEPPDPTDEGRDLMTTRSEIHGGYSGTVPSGQLPPPRPVPSANIGRAPYDVPHPGKSRGRVVDLSEFLLARITDDEARAARIAEGYADEEHFWAPGHIVNLGALVSPARVLAECAAKRQIVSLCQRLERKSLNDNLWNIDEADEILAALALPYADHPDYDEAWRLA